MGYRKKLSKKDIKNLEQVLLFLKKERDKTEQAHNLDVVRRNQVEDQISALNKVLYG